MNVVCALMYRYQELINYTKVHSVCIDKTDNTHD